MTAPTMSQEKLQIPEAPPIAGLNFRRFRGEEDYPHMLEIINGCKDVDGIERSETLDDICRNYAHLTNCDPHQDMLLLYAIISFHSV